MIKLLSKQAKQFILELKMYLLSKGKREKEINEIIVELKDHLLEAELEGKSIKDITGGSPQIYMKSISQEMGIDARQILSLAPMSALLIMAFICFTPSIRGDFSLSKIGVWE